MRRQVLPDLKSQVILQELAKTNIDRETFKRMEHHVTTQQEIEQMIAHRHFASAIASLSALTDEEPADATWWSLLGQAYTEAGHQDSAIAALMRAVLLDDEGPATCEALGVAWLRRGDLETAKTWFHRGLQAVAPVGGAESPLRGSLLRNLSMAVMAEERPTAARFLLEEAAEASPRDLLTLHALSAQYLHTQRFDDAERLVERILEQPQLPRWIRESAEHRRELIAGQRAD